ncbi:MAG: hypothetical protein KGK03_02975 [Candidatus Omnitrophica bacterium]|nr:hypothetical protein [Candidatus Omnitrophota bacterium]
MRAAVLLYRYLEAELGLKRKDEKWIKQRLFEYYSSFNDRWFPNSYVEPVFIPPHKKKEIFSKYKALE